MSEANGHAESRGLALVGYYQASERVDDNTLKPVGERVATKVREGFPDALAVVVSAFWPCSRRFGTSRPPLCQVDGTKLGSETDPALVVCHALCFVHTRKSHFPPLFAAISTNVRLIHDVPIRTTRHPYPL